MYRLPFELTDSAKLLHFTILGGPQTPPRIACPASISRRRAIVEHAAKTTGRRSSSAAAAADTTRFVVSSFRHARRTRARLGKVTAVRGLGTD